MVTATDTVFKVVISTVGTVAVEFSLSRTGAGKVSSMQNKASPSTNSSLGVPRKSKNPSEKETKQAKKIRT